MKKIKDLAGIKFNRLTVLCYDKQDAQRRSVWKCLCDCGKILSVRGESLRTNHTRSCGCLQKEATREHCRALGKANAGSPGEAVTNIKVHSYKKSAAERGYTWGLTEEYTKFLFLQDCYYCGAKPREIKINKHPTSAFLNGIDRVDNDLGYNPANCVPCCKTCQFKKKECTMRIAEKMIEFKQTGYVRKEVK